VLDGVLADEGGWHEPREVRDLLRAGRRPQPRVCRYSAVLRQSGELASALALVDDPAGIPRSPLRGTNGSPAKERISNRKNCQYGIGGNKRRRILVVGRDDVTVDACDTRT
jgi:hypothetical protein